MVSTWLPTRKVFDAEAVLQDMPSAQARASASKVVGWRMVVPDGWRRCRRPAWAAALVPGIGTGSVHAKGFAASAADQKPAPGCAR
ncbi:hypothetical protein GCM10009126_14810 [Rhodanobacter caeni]|uniref:Uncharacterized protein n=1 Tax=Rhodanobacter caeni TaxID=657654 RepID=A0ABP3E5Y7_9GAMM